MDYNIPVDKSENDKQCSGHFDPCPDRLPIAKSNKATTAQNISLAKIGEGKLEAI